MRAAIVAVLLSAGAAQAWSQISGIGLTTDKPVYSIAGTDFVTVTVKNDSSEKIALPFRLYSVWRNGKLVFEEGWASLKSPTPPPLAPGASRSWVWQKRDYTGKPVGAGSYTVKFGPFYLGATSGNFVSVDIALTPTGKIAGTSRFPLAVGNEWSYAAAPNQSAKMKVSSTYKDGYLQVYYRILNLVGANRWAQMSGSTKPDLWVFPSGKSGAAVVLFKFNRPEKYTYSVQLPPLLTMVQMKVGNTNDTVETPAGRFTGCYKLNATPAGWGAGVSYWFAPGVGLVQYIEWKATTGVKLYRLQRAKITGTEGTTYTIGR